MAKRFLKIDKLSTASGINSGSDRPYRFGDRVLDENLNAPKDPGEEKVYFELSDYSTSYVFHENPRYNSEGLDFTKSESIRHTLLSTNSRNPWVLI